jgi:hypothetical protein
MKNKRITVLALVKAKEGMEETPEPGTLVPGQPYTVGTWLHNLRLDELSKCSTNTILRSS